MLIVGQVSSEEERYEIQYVAHVFIVVERFRFLARQQREKLQN
jgi:hypothetical protein